MYWKENKIQWLIHKDGTQKNCLKMKTKEQKEKSYKKKKIRFNGKPLFQIDLDTRENPKLHSVIPVLSTSTCR